MKITPAFRALAAIILCVAAGAEQAYAQEYAVTRRTYSYYSDRLDVEVLATSAGQLQVIRGDYGRIEIAAHASQGLAGFGLSGETNILRLTALGAQEADYIIVVPERVSVRVKLPGNAHWRNADRYSASNFRWDATPLPPQPEIGVPQPTMEGKYFVVEARQKPPTRVRLLDGARVRSIEIRLEGTEFQMASTSPLTISPGARDLIDVDPGQNVDLVLSVPAFTRNFELRAGAITLFAIQEGRISDVCGNGARLKTPAGSTRYKYHPSPTGHCLAR